VPSPPPPTVLTSSRLWLWVFPGSALTSIDWSITSAANAGTVYGSGTASGADLTAVLVTTNAFGYRIYETTLTFPGGVSLASGTYWLNIQNAIASPAIPIFWDESDGPSLAYQFQPAAVSVPSETFQTVKAGPSIVYDNTNAFVNDFDIDSWTINFGFIVSNSFVVP